jgi:hypothetical protein
MRAVSISSYAACNQNVGRRCEALFIGVAFTRALLDISEKQSHVSQRNSFKNERALRISNLLQTSFVPHMNQDNIKVLLTLDWL